jgi:plastocyanin
MKARNHMKPWILLGGVAVLALLVLAACGGGAGAPASTAPSATGTGAAAVSIANFAFTPQALTVKAGTTVTWTNNDGAPHTVTSTDGSSTDAKTTSAFDSGNLGPGETFSFTFDKPGTFYYACAIHAAQASMHGIVVVQ